eukprot:2575112-Rhodomonas_salina.1
MTPKPYEIAPISKVARTEQVTSPSSSTSRRCPVSCYSLDGTDVGCGSASCTLLASTDGGCGVT